MWKSLFDKDEFQFAGFERGRTASKYVDSLSDNDLKELNGLLRWNCFTVDAHGRRFGRPAGPGKREAPQVVPDPRILELHKRFDLSDKHVLEFGCFEGVHTIGLAMFAEQVTGVDSRIENVVKAMVRCSFFGCAPTLFKCDLEDARDAALLPEADVVHHVGVLYHLVDPVTHLLKMSKYCRHGLMLDTHYSHVEKADKSYMVNGRSFRYFAYKEGGREDVFSGMGDHAKWLTLETLKSLLSEIGFGEIQVVENYEQRNGPRMRLFAQRGRASDTGAAH